jgi:hypothetical protein
MAPVYAISSSLQTASSNGLAHKLLARAPPPVLEPCAGCLDPSKVNNKLYFALFAIIGAAIVVVSIWFFLHAKNGGFHWHQDDWSEYKSTVLRKKDANGKTIYSGRSTIMPPSKTDRLAARSVVGYDEKGRKGIMAVRGLGGSHSVYYSDSFTEYTGDRGSDTMTSVSRNEKAPRTKDDLHTRMRGGHADTQSNHSRRYRDRDLQDYKHEKPARVGGMNRCADGVSHDFGSDTMTDLTSSTTPILSSSDKKRQKEEKKAADDAARMERKWRKEAERAAAALAKESSSSSPSKPKEAATPPRTSKPDRTLKPQKPRNQSSRSTSPQKQKQRDYSFSGAADESSTLYTAQHNTPTCYTATSTTRTTSSYYDAYRPLTQSSPVQQQQQQQHNPSRSRNSSASPSKKHRNTTSSDRNAGGSGRYERVKGSERNKKSSGGAGRDVMAGYRRGGRDDLDSDSE